MSLAPRRHVLCVLVLGISLLQSSRAAENQRCDLLVYGSTPGGVACAVRAAREGLDVILVTHAQHLGGLLSSGLSTMDTLYNGPRAPLYDELRAAIHEHYLSTYGKDSEPYGRSLPGNAKTKYEAHVAEGLIDQMLAQEKRIQVIKEFYPIEARSSGRRVESVTFRSMQGEERLTVQGTAVADCSYEADLAALANVPYRVGRESREEFNEEHAGKIFMRSVPWPPKHVDAGYLADYQKLNLVHYKRWYEIIRPQSTGAADPAVQAYNMRTVLTNNPANRLPVAKPAGYDREALMKRLAKDVKWSKGVAGSKLPNQKTYWNLPELIGTQDAYVEGDWATRKKVTDEHIQFTLSLMYFLQTDESVEEDVRKKWNEWGLPKDEFADNGHMPYEIYMRETRRIKGRAVFTENEARLAPRLKRAPLQGDSISITEWFLDSHACTPEEVPGSLWEGELLLNNITFPGQISWRTMLPEKQDNLLVPVCLSSSHIGWGAIRLEPTWMSLGEAAAWAVVLAKKQGVEPAAVEPDLLVRKVADHGIMTSFFNDVEKHSKKPWYGAVQYLGTQGYFGSYDALPARPLTAALAKVWAAHTGKRCRREAQDATAAAQMSWEAEQMAGETVTAEAFARLLDAACATVFFTTQLTVLGLEPAKPINRANASRLIYAAPGSLTPKP